MERHWCRRLIDCAIGIPQAAAEQSPTYQDADLGNPIRSARVSSIVDRARQEQIWTLLHVSRSQDGPVRRHDQRAPGTRPHQPPAKGLPGPQESQGQDYADSRQQSHSEFRLSGSAFIQSLTSPDCAHSKQRLPSLHGPDCRCPDIPPSQGDCQGRFLARHEGQLDRLSHLACLCPAVPPREHLGALLQHRRLHHRHLHQRTHQEEEARCPQAKALR